MALAPNGRAKGEHSHLVSHGSGTGTGYLIRLRPEQLDSNRFVALAEAGRRWRPARIGMRVPPGRGLALWRGSALVDVPDHPVILAEIARLEELLLVALANRLDAELALGRYEKAVGELAALVVRHPTRERFWAQLMRGLYHLDRRSEALAAYLQIYRHLKADLGVEPGRPLQELHARILRGELRPVVTSRHTAHAPVPRQLLLDRASFTGRTDALSQLDELLPDPRPRDEPRPIGVITGASGTGKSALAVRWAHRTRSRRDGCR